MDKPLVTVFVPSYNHNKYIVEALNSVKNQTYNNLQFIVIDDCSTDNSVELIQNWIKANSIDCTFIKHDKNLGICKTLNEVLKIARGKYLCSCTSDDIILPKKIEKQVRILEEIGDKYGLVFSDTYLIDENGELQKDTFHSIYFPFFKQDKNCNYFETLLKGNIIHGLATTWRTDIVKAVGGWDESLFAEDWDLNIRLSLKTKIYFDSSYVSAKYRITPYSLNNNPKYRLRAVDSSFDSLIRYYGISDLGNSNILNQINYYAWELYKQNYPSWNSKFVQLFKLKKTYRNLFFYIIAKCLVSYPKLFFIRNFSLRVLRKTKKTLNKILSKLSQKNDAFL